MAWHIITGEYAGRSGGVGQYVSRLASGLAAEGVEVHVWHPLNAEIKTEGSAGPATIPSNQTTTSADRGPREHRVPGGFSPAGIRRLARELDAFPGPRTVLLQYAPNALGLRGCNVPFCLWLLARSRLSHDDVRVMFHEPYFYFARQSARRNLLAAIHRVMAVLLLAAARRIYVSTASWTPLLRPLALGRKVDFTCLPIPTTLSPGAGAEDAGRVRLILLAECGVRYLVGHFGTYGAQMRPMMEAFGAALLVEQPDCGLLFLGEGGPAFRDAFRRQHPSLASRTIAPGFLADPELAGYLRACECVAQPYPDGVTTRRTSVMAPLALGVPVVTNAGPFTEPVWHAPGSLILEPTFDAGAFTRTIAALLPDAPRRDSLGVAGRALYEEHFSLEHTLRLLLDRPATHAPAR